MGKVKKERSANFSLEETRHLLRIALNYKDVLESKVTNAGVNKANAWNEIYKAFTASAPAGVRILFFSLFFAIQFIELNSIVFQTRTLKSLKEKYKTTKRGVRERKASQRRSALATGGDQAPAEPKNEIEEFAELEEVMALSVHGLTAEGDDDEMPTHADDDSTKLVFCFFQ